MKPWTLPKYRRRFIAKLPMIIAIVWIIAILLWTMLAINSLLKQTRPTPVRPQTKTRVVLLPTATPTPPPTDEQMIKGLPNGQLVWATYGHESTYGKNDGCKSKGQFNGFGYAQSTFGYQCFSSLKEVATKVSHWFDEKINVAGMSATQALCYYNTGKLMDSCGYADYSLAL